MSKGALPSDAMWRQDDALQDRPQYQSRQSSQPDVGQDHSKPDIPDRSCGLLKACQPICYPVEGCDDAVILFHGNPFFQLAS